MTVDLTQQLIDAVAAALPRSAGAGSLEPDEFPAYNRGSAISFEHAREAVYEHRVEKVVQAILASGLLVPASELLDLAEGWDVRSDPYSGRCAAELRTLAGGNQ